MQGFLSFFGYLDPGTGSIIIQAVIGVAAGVAVFGRRAIGGAFHKVRSLFSRKPGPKQDASSDKDDSDNTQQAQKNR